MNHVVPFGGGFDSFYILHSLVHGNPALNIKKVKSTGKIIAVTVRSQTLLSGLKYEAESEAVKKLKVHFPSVHFETVDINHHCTPHGLWRGKKGIYQPLLWVLTVCPFLSSGDMLYLGHLRDESLSGILKGALMNIVNGISCLDVPHDINARPSFHLLFPLEGLTKAQVLAELLDAYGSDILYQCVSCEYGQWCGNCVSCGTMKTALITLLQNKKYESMSRKALRKLFNIDVNVTQWKNKDMKYEGSEHYMKE